MIAPDGASPASRRPERGEDGRCGGPRPTGSAGPVEGMAEEEEMAGEGAVACARCEVPREGRACDSEGGAAPRGCPTREQEAAIAAAREVYSRPEVRVFAQHASRQEAGAYARSEGLARPTLTRVEEVCAFAGRAGFSHLGVAFCAGLIHEAATLDRILSARGFAVTSAVCKVGGVAKEELGLGEGDKVRPGCFEAMCNPVAQAELLNRAGTELNILLGLCVGHDALFLRHASAPCTVLAVKDRVLGHNPLAALYTSGSYYARLLDGAPSAAPRGRRRSRD
jgi:uncharacterized metal-binding protein